MAVLTVATSAMVALPILLLPLGIREGVPAYILVNRAYAAANPYDPNKKEVLVEDYAISGASLNTDTVNGLEPVETSAPVSDSPTPTDGAADATPTPDDSVPVTIDPETGRPLVVVGEGQTVSATHIEGSAGIDATLNQYPGILTATVVQTFDEGDVPVELLDPSTFLSDDTTMYIKYTDSIIKETPIMSSVTTTAINKGKEVVRIGIGDTWSKIRTEDGVEGYIPSKGLSENMVFTAIDRTVWVDTSGLKLRSEPSTGSDIIMTLNKNTPLHCEAVAAKWYQVTTSDGTEGYIYISYTTTNPPPTPTPTPKKTTTKTVKKSGGSAVAPTITGVNGESIVNICVSMLGVNYVWAGESRSGVDCSGLVVYAYRQIGISLPHQSNSLKKCGISIDRADIAPGDIVCWDIRGSSESVEHVGIYVGGGQVIHASSTRDRVEYGSVDMYPIVSIRRIIS